MFFVNILSSTVLLVLLAVGVRTVTNNYGYCNLADTVVSQSQFNSLFANNNNAKCKSFYALFYDGSKVTDPFSYDGCTAGQAHNGDISLVNSKIAYPSGGPARDNDGILIPKYVTGQTITTLGDICYGQSTIWCQGKAAIDALNQANFDQLHTYPYPNTIGRVWILIGPQYGSGWDTNKLNNQAFIDGMIYALCLPQSQPNFLIGQAGIISNSTDWNAVVTSTYVPFSCNGNPTLLYWNDCKTPQSPTGYSTSPFGGWSLPSKHQYSCNTNPTCNVAGLPGNTVYFPTP